jgi:hypothetical protein
MKDAVALYSSPTNPLPSSQPSRASTTLSWILPIHSFASFSRLLRISKILEAIIISAARSQVPQITTNSTKIFVISFFANLFVLYCYSPPFLYIFFFLLLLWLSSHLHSRLFSVFNFHCMLRSLVLSIPVLLSLYLVHCRLFPFFSFSLATPVLHLSIVHI